MIPLPKVQRGESSFISITFQPRCQGLKPKCSQDNMSLKEAAGRPWSKHSPAGQESPQQKPSAVHK